MKWAMLFLLVFLPFTLAHLEGGEDVFVDGLFLNFGYTPSELEVGTLSTLSFSLADPTSLETIPYEQAFVRISGPDGVEYSGYMTPDNDVILFSYSFSRGGSYEVLVQFESEDVTLTGYTFTLDVHEDLSYGWASLAVLIILGLYLLYRKKK